MTSSGRARIQGAWPGKKGAGLLALGVRGAGPGDEERGLMERGRGRQKSGCGHHAQGWDYEPSQPIIEKESHHGNAWLWVWVELAGVT